MNLLRHTLVALLTLVLKVFFQVEANLHYGFWRNTLRSGVEAYTSLPFTAEMV